MDEKKKYLVALDNELRKGTFEFGMNVGTTIQLVQAEWDDVDRVLYLGFKTNLYPQGITSGFKYDREIPNDIVENFITKEIEIPAKFLKILNFN